MKKYWKIIKDLQLNGTLDSINEEIRLHYDSEFERVRENPSDMVHIHFIDKLVEYLKVDPELMEQINYIHWTLSIEDPEFMESKKKYQDKVDAIEQEKRDKRNAILKEDFDKASPETQKIAIDLIKKFFNDLNN